MARRRRKSVRARRDPNVIATRSVLRPVPSLRSGRSVMGADRRFFVPDPVPLIFSPRRVLGSPTATPVGALGPKASLGRERPRVTFPAFSFVCERRRVRRRVIHAKGVAGGRVRRPRFNSYSKVSCHASD